MSRTTAKNLGICLVQLFATVGLSIGFFGRSPRLMALTAPIAIFIAPISALLDRNQTAFFVWLPIDMTFLTIMALLIVKNRKVAASVVLFLFNFASVMLTLGAY
jgi:hypothetical protein